MEHGPDLVDYGFVALRVVHFVTLMTALGTPAFRYYGVAAPLQPTALARFDRWLADVVLPATLAALATGLLMVATVAAMTAGSATASVDPAILRTVIRQSSERCRSALIAVIC